MARGSGKNHLTSRLCLLYINVAYINRQGLVDDGGANLSVAGDTQLNTLTCTGVISSSVGAFGELRTQGNLAGGQNLGAPNTWSQVTQWLTSSLNSPGVVAANNGLTGSVVGLYFHSVAMSFSGSVGTYTFALFVNGQQDNTLQTTIASGQSFPVAVTISDLDFHGPSDLPCVHDIRVKCSNAGANFQLNYGAFNAFRIVG